MATLAQTHKPKLAHIVFVQKRDEMVEKIIPRRCMVVSVALILAGLSIPMLMLLELLPATLLFAFVGLALAATGGVLVLFYRGEI